MPRPIFSAAWYRVATLTPRIRTNALIARHQYRGQTWYVLRDVASNRVYRFHPASYALIGAIIVLGLIGYAADYWLGASPWLLLVGLLLGVIVGFYELAKVVFKR